MSIFVFRVLSKHTSYNLQLYYPTCLLLFPLSTHLQWWRWGVLADRVLVCPVPPPMKRLGVWAWSEIAKNAPFHSAFLAKTLRFTMILPSLLNSAASLNTLYTAESEQFNSTLLPKTWSLTSLFHWKPSKRSKTHSYKDNAKFQSMFLVSTLSYALRFWRNRGVIENFKYLSKFEDFLKCWLYCVLYLSVIERCKKMHGRYTTFAYTKLSLNRLRN